MNNSPVVFHYPGEDKLQETFANLGDFETGSCTFHEFPDGESYVRIESEVRDRELILFCSLHHPNDKFLAIHFFAKQAKEMGARKITLIAGYLAYMRQDKRFHPGECITSEHFAKLLSGSVDRLITVDPHLHRRKSMDEIYSIPTTLVHAAPNIAEFIKRNIQNPLLIGPDGESEQWVSEVAHLANVPYQVLLKERLGDRDVKVTLPDVENYQDSTPVLVDDIISTGKTMIETILHLKNLLKVKPVCIGVHAVFADKALSDMQNAGAGRIISCNTIPHSTNEIDLAEALLNAYQS